MFYRNYIGEYSSVIKGIITRDETIAHIGSVNPAKLVVKRKLTITAQDALGFKVLILILGLYWGNIGKMENELETAI